MGSPGAHASSYVDHLPSSMDSVWLNQIFKHNGSVLDVYVSRKRRKNTALKFGFVRHGKEGDMRKAIERFNSLEIRGRKILVKQARYERQNLVSGNVKLNKGLKEGRRYEMRRPTRQWKNSCRDGRSYKQALQHEKGRSHINEEEEEEENTIRRITLKTVADNVQWLNRSLVGITSQPLDLDALRMNIMKEWPQIEDLRDMGRYKFLFNF